MTTATRVSKVRNVVSNILIFSTEHCPLGKLTHEVRACSWSRGANDDAGPYWTKTHDRRCS